MFLQLLFVAGLTVSALTPRQQDGKKPAVDIPHFAKVEAQGDIVTVHADWEPMYLDIAQPGKPAEKLPLDLSKLKGWSDEKLLKANGRIVRITGTLKMMPVEFRRGKKEQLFVLVAQTLEIIERDDNPPKDP